METITHTKTGQRALIPAVTVKGLRALGAKGTEALNTLVSDAHNPHPVAVAVTKAVGVKAI
jgi:hypothetical protein